MKRLFVSNQKLDMLAIVQSQTLINLQTFATGYPGHKNDSYVLDCEQAANTCWNLMWLL